MTKFFFNPSSFERIPERQFAQLVADGQVVRALEAGSKLDDRVNCTAVDGVTALLIAVERENREMVSALLHSGANPNGGPYRSPVHQAMYASNLDIFEDLLKAGADPNGMMEDNPALYNAARYDMIAAAKLLLAYGADINSADSLGITAVTGAAATESWDMVNFLLDRGASIWIAAPASGTIMPRFALNDRLDPDSPRGKAREEAIRKIKAAGFPWPPPHPKEVKRLLSEGKWPPHHAK
jgi:ankyrin repeat protein